MMKKIKAVLFDLDGTLLPMDQEVFLNDYLTRLATRMAAYGYRPKELIAAVMKGTYAMVANDGKVTNEEAFWNVFYGIYGVEAKAHASVYEEFYHNEFDLVKASCGFAKEAREIVDLLKKKGYVVALATNPVFPAEATKHRVSWAGLSFEDFALVTTYENSCYCKPNPKYYLDVCERIGVSPEACLMVGNDVTDDMVAKSLGMEVFLLTDCLINTREEDVTQYPRGDFAALKAYVERELS